MRDARRWMGARSVDACQHFRLDRLLFVVNRRLFAHRTAPEPLKEFYRDRASPQSEIRVGRN